MMLTRYVEYRQKPSLQFFCLQCACDSDGHYNFSVSLEHIACLAPDVSRMRDQAETENRYWHCMVLLCHCCLPRTHAMLS